MMDANVVDLGNGTVAVRLGPDPDQAFRDIIRALKVDEHDAHDCIKGDNDKPESLYEAWQAGNYAGCFSCQAAYIARAALERRNYTMDWRFTEDD